MANGYISIQEAATRSGLHVETLKRLLREGVIEGYKAVAGGRRRWRVSIRSLDRYTNPIQGFLLDLPGPKLFLHRQDEAE